MDIKETNEAAVERVRGKNYTLVEAFTIGAKWSEKRTLRVLRKWLRRNAGRYGVKDDACEDMIDCITEHIIKT